MSNYAHITSVPAASTNTGRHTSARALPTWAAPAALGAVLVLSAVLYGWALGSLGWGNSYYSAAVKSMGQSSTNFLFGAFDPAGVVHRRGPWRPPRTRHGPRPRLHLPPGPARGRLRPGIPLIASGRTPHDRGPRGGHSGRRRADGREGMAFPRRIGHFPVRLVRGG